MKMTFLESLQKADFIYPQIINYIYPVYTKIKHERAVCDDLGGWVIRKRSEPEGRLIKNVAAVTTDLPHDTKA